MSDPLVTLYNNHTASSGDPPIVDSETSKRHYIGYFENPHGEQWIFTLDRESGQAVLRGGDIGWNEAIDITDGVVDIVLAEEEQLWLQACLLASKSSK